MADLGRSKLIDGHIAALKKLKGKKVEAGWFETNRYAATGDGSVGISVAVIARIMEFGVTIDHPGGTKYITDAIVKGRYVGTRFVANDFQGDHKVTGPHKITIPARPFMRLAWSNFNSDRVKIQTKIAKQLVAQTISPDQALSSIGDVLEKYISKSMRNGGWAGNAPSTIRVKGFDKPLFHTGQMFQTLTSKVS